MSEMNNSKQKLMDREVDPLNSLVITLQKSSSETMLNC